MKNIYIIELDESNDYDTHVRILNEAFTSYAAAKAFLLTHFNAHGEDQDSEWFDLKKGHEYASPYGYGAMAGIIALTLVEE